MKKSWRLLPHDGSAIDRLAGELGTSPIVAQLLLNRNVKTADDARRFLNTPMSDLHEPETVPGIPDAAQRIHQAVRDQRPICIYGDYDVDGVTGTAILYTMLKLLGAKVEFHVPHRLNDGYGLNAKTLEQIAANGVSLVVTVDCGIASIDEAETARKLGLELLITDHHEFKSDLPQADVLVHPRLDNGSYPFDGLSGAGVAFKLAWAVAKLASGGDKVTTRLREFLLDAIVFAAMGAVADVMPLLGENRIFVRHGLARMQQSPGEGIRALLAAARLDGKAKLVASDIGFTLGPRINAAGRLGSAQIAVELLTTTNPHQAEDLARRLEELNQQRQQMEKHIYFEAREMAEQQNWRDRSALVLAKGNWHQGLIGIVAGRLADLYNRPSLMIAVNEEEKLATGSGRSIPGFKLHEALEACSDHLVRHGGHAAAAGFKLHPTSIPMFRDSFCSVAADHFTDGPLPPQLTIDAEVPLSALTMKVVESIALLEPYGHCNPSPLLLAGDLQIVGEPKKVGQDKHLSFRVREHKLEMRAIAFGMADRLDEIMSDGGKCCVVFTPRINEWQGWKSVELLVRDFQPGSRAKLQ